MAPGQIHLPNGQSLNVTPVFGGLYFKSNELSHHHNVFPPGWTIILNCEDDDDDDDDDGEDGEGSAAAMARDDANVPIPKKTAVHRFRRPTLKNDHLFLASISNPASNEFKPPTSPTRQIAMMLWATLYWYFHQPEPDPQLATSASESTPHPGRPKGEWRIYINREGIFKGKHLLQKLERMGLIASEDSSVGLDTGESPHAADECRSRMFVSRRSFWQMDPRIYLFTLTPLQTNSPFPSSPAGSRPASPNRNSRGHDIDGSSALRLEATVQSNLIARASTPPGPFYSSSHLPTFYPPPPLQYTFTANVRHPIRPKPPKQGETFYIRYIPSLGQYLTFRVASLAKRPITYSGPFSQSTSESSWSRHHPPSSSSEPLSPNATSPSPSQTRETTTMTDVELLHKWMNDPRVAHSWGETGPASHQEAFLKQNLTNRHSMPVIGCFDGKPFGYFEIYWAKEDRLAQFLGGACDDWDRGLHVLVGEQEFRGPHRFKVWINALVHYCWLADPRTNVVMLEPRVDNFKIRQYLEEEGFFKEREIAFPHKQSNLMKIRREAWSGPAL